MFAARVTACHDCSSLVTTLSSGDATAGTDGHATLPRNGGLTGEAEDRNTGGAVKLAILRENGTRRTLLDRSWI